MQVTGTDEQKDYLEVHAYDKKGIRIANSCGIMYCIVTCGARDNNQLRSNPTWWQRCSAWRVLQPRKRRKGEGGEGTYHRHPDQAIATWIAIGKES